MKLEKPCIPWYFPKNDTSTLRLCDPWEAMDFRKIMDTTPVNYYSHCLTDCSGIIYQASITAAPFSRCDFKNIGVSDLCDFDVELNPTIWGQSVLDQYGDEVEKAKKKLVTSGGAFSGGGITDEATSGGAISGGGITDEETSGGAISGGGITDEETFGGADSQGDNFAIKKREITNEDARDYDNGPTSQGDTSQGDTIQGDTFGGVTKKKEITIPDYITKGVITNLRKYSGKS